MSLTNSDILFLLIDMQMSFLASEVLTSNMLKCKHTKSSLKQQSDVLCVWIFKWSSLHFSSSMLSVCACERACSSPHPVYLTTFPLACVVCVRDVDCDLSVISGAFKSEALGMQGAEWDLQLRPWESRTPPCFRGDDRRVQHGRTASTRTLKKGTIIILITFTFLTIKQLKIL